MTNGNDDSQTRNQTPPPPPPGPGTRELFENDTNITTRQSTDRSE